MTLSLVTQDQGRIDQADMAARVTELQTMTNSGALPAPAVVAAGATQGNATAIKDLSVLIQSALVAATSVSTRGVALPAAVTGRQVILTNNGATYAVKVYPKTVGQKIGAAASGAAEVTTLAAGVTRTYKAVNAILWVAQPIAAPATIAAAGATQGTATLIRNKMVFVTATASTEGVKLPYPSTGMEVVIVNKGTTQPVKVYANTSGKIDAAATNAADGTNLAALKTTTYRAVNTKLWVTQRGA